MQSTTETGSRFSLTCDNVNNNRELFFFFQTPIRYQAHQLRICFQQVYSVEL